MLTDELRQQIWSSTDNDGLTTPHVDGPVPFGLTPAFTRLKVFHWLVCNVAPLPPYNDWSEAVKTTAPAAFISSHELGDLLYHDTGIDLTDAQVQEALLLLGVEPLDGEAADWLYKVHRECPCASVALDKDGELTTVDRGMRVTSVTIL